MSILNALVEISLNLKIDKKWQLFTGSKCVMSTIEGSLAVSKRYIVKQSFFAIGLESNEIILSIEIRVLSSSVVNQKVALHCKQIKIKQINLNKPLQVVQF